MENLKEIKINLVNNWIKIVGLFMAVALISCDGNRFFEKHVQIESSDWLHGEPVVIESPELTDTTAVYHCLLDIRHFTNYPFSNIYLRIKTIYPSGKEVMFDLPSIDLQDKNGYWYGEGSSDLRDMRVYFKRNVKFDESGVYRFEVQHRMRKEVLTGVSDIGIRLEFAGK